NLRPAPALPDSEVREFALELRPKVAELRPELITANGVNPACGQDLLRLAGGDDVGPVLVVGVLTVRLVHLLAQEELRRAQQVAAHTEVGRKTRGAVPLRPGEVLRRPAARHHLLHHALVEVAVVRQKPGTSDGVPVKPIDGTAPGLLTVAER